MNANLQLPIGCLADDLFDEVEELELQRRGDELLEQLEREREEKARERRNPIYLI